MLMNFNIDNVARDVAFEIHLGGDRFDARDLCEVLRGIPKADLETFRERTLLHARDFVPDEPRFKAFAERMVNLWLEDVETAEALGRTSKGSWFKDVNLSDDMGKNFAMDDGTIRKCTKTTAEAAWGPYVREHIIGELSDREVVEHNVDALLSSYGYNIDGSRRYDFVTRCSFPDGELTSVHKGSNGYVFHIKGDVLPFEEVWLSTLYEHHPALLVEAVSYELDERVFRDIREAEIRRQDVSDFKLKADRLLDSAGERVCADFLYDQVELSGTEKGRVFVRRAVDDLAEHHQYYIFTKTPNGSVTARVSEDMDAGVLSRMNALMDERLDALGKEDVQGVSASQDRIDFLDGPVISVPSYSGDSGIAAQMKVRSLYVGFDYELMVDGTMMGSSDTAVQSFYLSTLSDKSVKAVREASDKALSLFEKRQPAPALQRSAAARVPKAVKKGSEITI